MIKLSVTKARQDFSDLVDAAYAKSERVILERNGKQVAALISIEDLRAFERLEEEQDKELVRQRLRDSEEAIPWEEAKKRLGW